jgi:hypothetical protein
MSATSRPRGARRPPSASQRGTAAVEFALLASIFFTLVFGVMEVARILYVYNTLQEVTRRAAAAGAQVYPTDANGVAKVKQYAVFRNSPGELLLSSPVTDNYIRLSYLNHNLAVIPANSLPPNAEKNREICMKNPNADSCIRFVQAQVCKPDVPDACENATSTMLLPLVDLGVQLHKATTIVTVESLGYVPGSLPCGCP